MIKKIFRGIQDYLYKLRYVILTIFGIFLAAVIWGPLAVPLRCMPSSGGSDNGGNAGIGLEGVSVPITASAVRDLCYSPLYLEYWKHPEWRVQYSTVVDYMEFGFGKHNGIHFFYDEYFWP